MYDNLALYYDEENNVFIDGEGEVVFEIFEIITPNDLYLFKHNQTDTIVNHSTLPGMLVVLYWPDQDFVYG